MATVEMVAVKEVVARVVVRAAVVRAAETVSVVTGGGDDSRRLLTVVIVVVIGGGVGVGGVGERGESHLIVVALRVRARFVESVQAKKSVLSSRGSTDAQL